MPNNTLFADEFAKAITAWSPNLAALVGPELAAATAQATEAAGEAQAAATLAQGLVDALPDGIGTGVTPYQVGIEGVGQGDAAKDTEALNLAIDLAISLNTYVTWRGTLHIRPGGTSLGPYYGGDTNPIYTANPTAGLYVNASVVSINGVARNLGDVVDMGSAFYTAETAFTENDQLNVRYGRNGTGAIVAPLFVNVVGLEYTAFP